MSTFTDPGPADELLSGFGEHAPADEPRQHRRTGLILTVAFALVLAGGAVGLWLLAPTASSGPAAHLAAFDQAQQADDRIDADDAGQLQVDPASTRLLVRTSTAASYAARSVSGRLCVLQIPAGDVSVESCGPNRKGVVLTVGTDAGQVRLVADGGPTPTASDGWTSAGPNVWTRS